MMNLKGLSINPKIWGPILSLVAIIVIMGIIDPGFVRIEFKDGRFYGSLIDVLVRATPTAIIALGMAVVIGTRGIDLSVGSVVAICGAVAAMLITETDLSFASVMVLSLAAGGVIGMLNGIMVSYIGIQPIIATLILMVSGRGIAQLITGGRSVSFDSVAMDIIGSGMFLAIPVRIWIAAGLLLLTILVMRKTAIGLFIESVGANARASRYVGIEARLFKMFAYVFSGICAALAGVILIADVGIAEINRLGLWLELDAILAVVLAGGSLNGGRIYLGLTIIGALIIQTLTTIIFSSGVPVEYNLIVKASIILAVLLVQSPTTQAAIKDLNMKRKGVRT
ncbi:ABC transporter permease [Reinekea blandensis]|uniref:ABC transporter, membrane spanning protein (Ribose) n=1 Tax=Reinekea blandensis MED297 TaxID=314283 RepID=A4BFA9_9GAMM|nr:ABC transporter permease [Reinekea blandensis]EAR09222.1 ABC transporter, membrane spanning protein (ribose) [Reinekea sp. MED297] [Reinekea blandensis MED297]